MGSLTASGEDVIRWQREGRTDILAFASVMGPPGDPFADLWDGSEWQRAVSLSIWAQGANQNRYLCRIYETRPQIYRDYIPWAFGTLCEIVR
jgi:hypothetical protein